MSRENTASSSTSTAAPQAADASIREWRASGQYGGSEELSSGWEHSILEAGEPVGVLWLVPTTGKCGKDPPIAMNIRPVGMMDVRLSK